MSEGFGSQEPGGDKPREESPGEASYRWGGLLLLVLRLIAGPNSYQGKRFEDAAAVLARPILLRYPRLAKWKAPKK